MARVVWTRVLHARSDVKCHEYTSVCIYCCLYVVFLSNPVCGPHHIKALEMLGGIDANRCNANVNQCNYPSRAMPSHGGPVARGSPSKKENPLTNLPFSYNWIYHAGASRRGPEAFPWTSFTSSICGSTTLKRVPIEARPADQPLAGRRFENYPPCGGIPDELFI